MYFEKLDNRRLLRVSGIEAEHFLENLVTCKVTDLKADEAPFGALLSPQGKILFDFFMFKIEGAFVFDVPAALMDDFLKRLTFYRLRAKVDIERLEGMPVTAVWGVSDLSAELAFMDYRNDALGFRCYGTIPEGFREAKLKDKRIEIGIPEGHVDFEYGDAYPHETLMDQFGGVDFKKGCYVGQEVVSRMQHRGSAKKRIVQVSSEEILPEPGTAVSGDGKPVGTLGSTEGKKGLAMLRLDRAQKAETLTSGDVPVTVKIPEWVNFGWPEKA
ncbi:MAG: folate-binding protein [Pseudomonadota bacterium]